MYLGPMRRSPFLQTTECSIFIQHGLAGEEHSAFQRYSKLDSWSSTPLFSENGFEGGMRTNRLRGCASSLIPLDSMVLAHVEIDVFVDAGILPWIVISLVAAEH